MAIYFRLVCKHRGCGQPVVNRGEGAKARYVHLYEVQGVAARHDVTKVESIRLGAA